MAPFIDRRDSLLTDVEAERLLFTTPAKDWEVWGQVDDRIFLACRTRGSRPVLECSFTLQTDYLIGEIRAVWFSILAAGTFTSFYKAEGANAQQLYDKLRTHHKEKSESSLTLPSAPSCPENQ